MVIQEVAKILSSGNLQVIGTKIEVITLKRSNNDTEERRKIKKLGSLLGDKEHIKNRKKSCQHSLLETRMYLAE